MKRKILSIAGIITVLLISLEVILPLAKDLSANELEEYSGTFGETQTIPFFVTGSRIDKDIWYLSHGWTNGSHQSCEWRDNAVQGADGKIFITLSERGGKHSPHGCGEIHTNKIYGYGRYETRMKAVSGSGLNTAFFTYIGPHDKKEHDEIDFEFLGKYPKKVQVMHWRNGKRGPHKLVNLGFDASKEFHNYAFEWTPNKIKWFVDDVLVFETDGSFEVPSEGQRIFLSLWSGSDEINEWMGNFKYSGEKTAEFEWVKFTPYEPNKNDSVQEP